MIDVKGKVMDSDYLDAVKEARCLDECINNAKAGMVVGDLNMVRARLNDALRSANELNRLYSTKKSFDLAGEFLSKKAIESYEEQIRLGRGL